MRSLLWLANQNSITPHVWTSRAPKLMYPDICIFDLDPAREEPDVLRAATLLLRDLLTELGAQRIGERVQHDASSGVLPEETAQEWGAEWLTLAREACAQAV